MIFEVLKGPGTVIAANEILVGVGGNSVAPLAGLPLRLAVDRPHERPVVTGEVQHDRTVLLPGPSKILEGPEIGQDDFQDRPVVIARRRGLRAAGVLGCRLGGLRSAAAGNRNAQDQYEGGPQGWVA